MKIKTMFKVIIGALVLSITGLVIGLYAANNNVYAGAEPETEYTPNYLTLTSVEEGVSSTISFNCWDGYDTIEVKASSTTVTIDSNAATGDWQPYALDKSIKIPYGESVSFKGQNISINTNGFTINSGKISASGSVTSLSDGNGGNPNVTLNEGAFSHLFYSCDRLVSIDKLILPAKTLSKGCYAAMFMQSGITRVPDGFLSSAEALAEECYYWMFYDCEQLTSIPVDLLPAKTMVKSCYECMFTYCVKLSTLPNLPATTLAENCYKLMFDNCKIDLIATKDSTHAVEWKIPATSAVDAEDWNFLMFNGCISVDLQTSDNTPALNTTYYAYGHRETIDGVAIDFDLEISTAEELKALIDKGGNGFLKNDITVSSSSNWGGNNSETIDINLCLNGKKIIFTSTGSYFTFKKTNISIYDCVGEGLIQSGIDSSEVFFQLYDHSTMKIYGGTYKGYTYPQDPNAHGGGFIGGSSDSSIYLYDCTVVDWRCVLNYDVKYDSSQLKAYFYGGNYLDNGNGIEIDDSCTPGIAIVLGGSTKIKIEAEKNTLGIVGFATGTYAPSDGMDIRINEMQGAFIETSVDYSSYIHSYSYGIIYYDQDNEAICMNRLMVNTEPNSSNEYTPTTNFSDVSYQWGTLTIDKKVIEESHLYHNNESPVEENNSYVKTGISGNYRCAIDDDDPEEIDYYLELVFASESDLESYPEMAECLILKEGDILKFNCNKNLTDYGCALRFFGNSSEGYTYIASGSYLFLGCDEEFEITNLQVIRYSFTALEGEYTTQSKLDVTSLPGDGTYGCRITSNQNSKEVVYTDVVQIITHVHNGAKADGKAATCLEAGWKDYYECTCGSFYTDIDCTNPITDLAAWKIGSGKIDALGHSYGEWTTTKNPTCTEKGKKTHECTCGATEEEDINALGHSFSTEWTIEAEATCETKGSKSHHCTRTGCTEKSDVTEVDALGHSYGEYVYNNDATLDSDGTKTRICKNDATHKDTVAAEGTKKSKTIIDDASEAKVTTPTGFDTNVKVVVEVTVETEVESKINNNTLHNYNLDLEKNETVGVVFDVKLKRTINGVETEIQPTDLEGVTSITVLMKLPEGLDLTKVTRILHVHGDGTIDEYEFDASKVTSDGYYEITISKLSEFAFIYKTNNGMSTGSIVAIVVCSIFLLLLIIYLLGYFFCYRRGHLDDSSLKVIYKFLPRGQYDRSSNE